MFCVLQFECIDVFPNPSLLDSLYNGIPDDQIVGKFALFSLQFDYKIHLVCNRKFRATAYSLIVFNLFTVHHFFSHPILCR